MSYLVRRAAAFASPHPIRHARSAFSFSFAFVAIAVCALAFLVMPIPAYAAVIDIGGAFGTLQPYIDSAVGAVVTALVGWVLVLVQTKLNVNIDAAHREALQSWAQRQAASLVAAGAVRVKGLQVNVDSAALAGAANLALKEIPDALDRFGITPAKVGDMIVDHLPHVPAVAAAQAAQVSQAAPQ